MQSGTKFFIIDANFGLVRKKSSGSDVTEARVDNAFFRHQSAVNSFVAAYDDAKSNEVYIFIFMQTLLIPSHVIMV